MSCGLHLAAALGSWRLTSASCSEFPTTRPAEFVVLRVTSTWLECAGASDPRAAPAFRLALEPLADRPGILFGVATWEPATRWLVSLRAGEDHLRMRLRGPTSRWDLRWRRIAAPAFVAGRYALAWTAFRYTGRAPSSHAELSLCERDALRTVRSAAERTGAACAAGVMELDEGPDAGGELVLAHGWFQQTIRLRHFGERVEAGPLAEAPAGLFRSGENVALAWWREGALVLRRQVAPFLVDESRWRPIEPAEPSAGRP